MLAKNFFKKRETHSLGKGMKERATLKSWGMGDSGSVTAVES